MRLALGQPIRVSTEVRDISATLTDPLTVTLKVKKPDAASLTYAAPTKDSTGKYHQDIPADDLTLTGHYSFYWVTTGPAAGVSPPGDFDVYDPMEIAVLPLQDAKDALNIVQTNTAYDVEILVMVASIESALERITGGPLITTAVTERVRVGQNYRTLRLQKRPVVTVSKITDIASNAQLDISDIEVDTNAGIVRRRMQLPFWSTGPFFTVEYTAGWGTSLPPAFNLAARIILQHLWELQQGPSARPTMGPPELGGPTAPPAGFAVPARALEVMAPYASEVSL